MARKLNLGCGLSPRRGEEWLNVDVLPVDERVGWPDDVNFLLMDVLHAKQATMERFEHVLFCQALTCFPLEQHNHLAWQINGLLVMGGTVEVVFMSFPQVLEEYRRGLMNIRQVTSLLFGMDLSPGREVPSPENSCCLDRDWVTRVFIEEGFDRVSAVEDGEDSTVECLLFRKVAELHDCYEAWRGVDGA